jgi:PTS system nitrogen regulatory IIA component
MKLASVLTPERTRAGLQVASKKKALEQIADLFCESNKQIDQKELFQKLIERERLGTTGLGNGIAIPHCRLPDCDKITGALIQLNEGIDFGAFDKEPVRLIFLLIVPTEEVEEHLHVLSMLASRLQSDDYRDALLNAHTDIDLYNAALMEAD